MVAATKADPTAQRANRRRSTRRLSSRLNVAERQVKALFRAIPKTRRRETKIQNAEQTIVYDYQLSPQEQQDFERMVRYAISQQLLETQTDVMPPDWYWKEDIEQPYRQGTVEEVRDFNQMVSAAIVAGVTVAGLPPQEVPAAQVLFSEPYRASLASAQVSNFSTIKSLSDRTAAQVLQRINSGIQAGETPAFITNDISERFDVARSNAKRIADTEINKSYTNAKMDATRILADRTGLRAGVIHISALTPTTRSTHAARHGNAYTVADQQQWWDEGSNRINCKCSIQSVLIDSQGRVVQKAEQEAIRQEGKKFFANE